MPKSPILPATPAPIRTWTSEGLSEAQPVGPRRRVRRQRQPDEDIVVSKSLAIDIRQIPYEAVTLPSELLAAETDTGILHPSARQLGHRRRDEVGIALRMIVEIILELQLAVADRESLGDEAVE